MSIRDNFIASNFILFIISIFYINTAIGKLLISIGSFFQIFYKIIFAYCLELSAFYTSLYDINFKIKIIAFTKELIVDCEIITLLFQ